MKLITCIILGLVISNVFGSKNNSVYSDFVDACATRQAQPHVDAHLVNLENYTALEYIILLNAGSLSKVENYISNGSQIWK